MLPFWKKLRFWRLSLGCGIWVVLAIGSIFYSLKSTSGARFEFLLNSNGTVSGLQQEKWLQDPSGILVNDRIVLVDGSPFDYKKVSSWLREQKPGQKVNLTVERRGGRIALTSVLARYSKNTYLILFFIPFFLSVIFLGFALGVPIQKVALRRAREAVHIFAALCLGISYFFLALFPSTSLGIYFSPSVTVPLFGVLLLHIFLTYPKKKCSALVRNSILGFGYSVATLLMGARMLLWNSSSYAWIHSLNIPFVGICFLSSLGALGNTLLTSLDFWARRRARLMSLVFLAGFISVVSVFVAAVWEVPRLSVERILAVSLFFPTGFAVVFLKNNVFDLERAFRRGLHQLLLLGMATTFALLVGLGWSQWQLAPEADWMLWVAIAIVVVVISGPAGQWIEEFVHRLIRTRVRYPDVNEILSSAQSVEKFISHFAVHCEMFLNMKNIQFIFFQDPTTPWTPQNQQHWKFENGYLHRVFDENRTPLYSSALFRGDLPIGELRFDGEDALAFDPKTSPDWANSISQFSRSLEVLCLQEFISIQQGFLAVGRMQSLLAHEMKNPLAIIKVCSGLLSNHLDGSEEADELIRTIQGEVRRVASAIQNIFEHSGPDQKEKVDLLDLLKQVKATALSRFPKGEVEVHAEPATKLWIEKEGLRQTLNNLVINAFEAGSPSVKISVERSAEKFWITVKDLGRGISEKVDLFKPFVTTKPSGTGLGLANVKAFMDRNSGQIRVQSKKSEGTTFVLEFSKQLIMAEAEEV